MEAFEVEVDNSSLTGESSLARRYKSDQPILIKANFWLELPNIILPAPRCARPGARRDLRHRHEFGDRQDRQSDTENSTRVEPAAKQLSGTVYAIAALAGSLALGFCSGWLVAG